MIRRGPLLAATVLLATMFALDATPSSAHAVGVSRGEYRSSDTEVHADLVFARKELMAAFAGLDSDRDGELTRDEIERARGELSDWIGRGMAVQGSSAPCAGGLAAVTLAEQDGIAFTTTFVCPEPVRAFAVRLALFADLSPGHRHLVTAVSASRTIRAVVYEAQPQFELAAPDVATDGLDGAHGIGPSLFRLGVEHILTGYDHLLFLLALVLVTGPLRSLLGAITAFTLAHSITLAVAALGIWTPRSLLVEPAIALSIAFVGIENCRVSDLRGRWRLTFLFGLVHGFGFAGALGEIALLPAQLPLALASFNLGVEVGQLAVLSLVLPGVWWLQRRTWFATGGLRTSSIAISAMGLWWFVARVGGG